MKKTSDPTLYDLISSEGILLQSMPKRWAIPVRCVKDIPE